jgi:PHD/YefM family antitoxin component YafN of YafNO toxin-antitoxin module
MPKHTLLPENIHSLTDFLRNHKRHLQRLKRSQRPSVLTLNGKAKVVVLDAGAFQAMMEMMETHKGIADGLVSLKRGHRLPAKRVFARLRKKRL